MTQLAQPPAPETPMVVPWALLVLPDAVADSAKLVAWAEKSVAGVPKVQHERTLGAALYRAGRFAEAVAHLTEVTKTETADDGLFGSAGFFLAMAHHRLGHADDAKQWFDKSAKWLDEALAAETKVTAVATPFFRLSLQLLRRETAELLGR